MVEEGETMSAMLFGRLFFASKGAQGTDVAKKRLPTFLTAKDLRPFKYPPESAFCRTVSLGRTWVPLIRD